MESILGLIKERCEWLLKKKIDQWNPSFYLKKYDENYQRSLFPFDFVTSKNDCC